MLDYAWKETTHPPSHLVFEDLDRRTRVFPREAVELVTGESDIDEGGFFYIKNVYTQQSHRISKQTFKDIYYTLTNTEYFGEEEKTKDDH